MFPSYIRSFILKFLIVLLIFSLARLIFYTLNHSLFPIVYFTDFLVGIWFDAITTAILFLPLVVIELFPHNFRNNSVFKIILKSFFVVILAVGTLMNIADIEYFKFSSTRSTFSTLKMLSYGNDLGNQLPSFIKDYWLLFILYSILLFLGIWFYKKTQHEFERVNLLRQGIFFIVFAGLMVSLGRGLGVRPISPINASKYTIDQNVPLVLNSTFTIIKSLGNADLEEKNYFSSEDLKKWVNPIKQHNGPGALNKPNIVLIMIESFSVEYIKSINGDSISYTPFLDSLVEQGQVYVNCFANGKKSIDAVPSIISSVPKLMDQEFITSSYSTNTVESLPKALEKTGYYSAFFHGATNGSMNFNQYAAKARFNQYLGRTEYNNDSDFDGTWGIFDHLFMSWSVDQMKTFQQPFFSTIFTLSSHPPYTLPEDLKSKFNSGPTPMHNSVQYTDYALRLFFDKIKQEPWFQNTVFIITADHTPASTTYTYYKERGNMHIPLLFYHPDPDILRGRKHKIVSQIDILPSVLELVGYPYPFYSLGSSVFNKEDGFSVSKIGSKYLMFGYQHMLVLQNGKAIKLYHIDDKHQLNNLIKTKPETVKLLKNKLLAYIQAYHNGLINNTMSTETINE